MMKITPASLGGGEYAILVCVVVDGLSFKN